MVNVMKCTMCGNKITSEQKGSFAVCEGCGAEYDVAASKKLGKIADTKTKKLSGLRKIQFNSMNTNDIGKLSSVSKEILTIVESDYFSKYLFAYAENALGNGTYMSDFYELEEDESFTHSEIQLVLEHLYSFSDLAAKEDIKRYILGLSAIDNKFEYDKYLKCVDSRILSPNAFKNMQRDVFICHTSSENDIAVKLVEVLELQGCSCWISTRNLKSSNVANDLTNINKAIANCKVFLVVSCAKAMKSKDVKSQIATAEELNLKRVEYKIEDVAPTKIFESFFEGRAFVTGFDNSDEQKAMLCSRIHIDINSNTTLRSNNNTVSKNTAKTVVSDVVINKDEELRLKKIKTEKAALARKNKQAETLRLEKIKADEAALVNANIVTEELRLENIKSESAALLTANIAAEELRLKKIKADKAALTRKNKQAETLRLEKIKADEAALVNANIATEELRLKKIKAEKAALLKKSKKAEELRLEKQAREDEIRLEKSRVEEEALQKKKDIEDKLLAEKIIREEEIRVEKSRVEEEELLKKKIIEDELLAEQEKRDAELLAIQTAKNAVIFAKELKKDTTSGLKAYKAFMSGRYDAGEVTVIAIPADVTIIEKETFRGCVNLTRVIFNSNLVSIKERAFCNCISLTDVVIPDSVVKINDYAFYGCNSLESLTLGSSIRTIGDSAFRECTALTEVVIPENVIHIYDLAFAGCINLTDITIPDSITCIEQSLFLGCESLENIILPDSVTSIGVQAFRGCTILKSINITSTIKTIGKFAFLESGLNVKKKVSILNKKIHIDWVVEANKNLQKQLLAKVKQEEAVTARKDAAENARLEAIENAKKAAAEKAAKAEKATSDYKNSELAAAEKIAEQERLDAAIDITDPISDVTAFPIIEEENTSKVEEELAPMIEETKKSKTKKLGKKASTKVKTTAIVEENNVNLVIDDSTDEVDVTTVDDNNDQDA